MSDLKEESISIPRWCAEELLDFLRACAAFPARETLIPIGSINLFESLLKDSSHVP